MSEITVDPARARPPLKRLVKYALQALVFLPLIAGVIAYHVWITQSPVVQSAVNVAKTTTVSAATLEERFGIRVTLIAVTAAGGIVDLRYQIIDKEKAEFLLGESLPTLIAEARNITLLPPDHTMRHNTQLENDTGYFAFYPNTQTAVKRGELVSVVFGSVQLEPIAAQ